MGFDDEPEIASLHSPSTVCSIPENADEQHAQINALQTRIGKGSLSNLVWNIRNRYLGHGGETFSAEEMRGVIEGFLEEIRFLKERTGVDV